MSDVWQEKWWDSLHSATLHSPANWPNLAILPHAMHMPPEQALP